MPDINTHTELAMGVGVGTASVSASTFLGFEYAVFGVALLGACVAHIYLEEMTFKKMVSSIFGSFVLGLVAASLSKKILLAFAVHYFPFLEKSLISSQLEGSCLVAFIVAFTSQKTVPILFNWLDRKKGV